MEPSGTYPDSDPNSKSYADSGTFGDADTAADDTSAVDTYPYTHIHSDSDSFGDADSYAGSQEPG
jgi:hypothetical protein